MLAGREGNQKDIKKLLKFKAGAALKHWQIICRLLETQNAAQMSLLFDEIVGRAPRAQVVRRLIMDCETESKNARQSRSECELHVGAVFFAAYLMRTFAKPRHLSTLARPSLHKHLLLVRERNLRQKHLCEVAKAIYSLRNCYLQSTNSTPPAVFYRFTIDSLKMNFMFGWTTINRRNESKARPI